MLLSSVHFRSFAHLYLTTKEKERNVVSLKSQDLSVTRIILGFVQFSTFRGILKSVVRLVAAILYDREIFVVFSTDKLNGSIRQQLWFSTVNNCNDTKKQNDEWMICIKM